MSELLKVRLMLPSGSPADLGPGWTDVWLREGTSDEAVLNETWVMDVYHLRGLGLKAQRADANPMSQAVNRPLVVDIGACTGLFSALVLQMYPDCEVIAVEPEPSNFEILTLNTAKWRERSVLNRCAIGGHDGTTTLFGGHGTGYTVHDADSDHGGIPAILATLDTLIGTKRVALLKVDIEGGEYDAFAACPTETLKRVDRIHMEWHGTREAPHVADAPRRYGELLTKLAYTHSVQTFGEPDAGGMLFAHRNDL